MNNVLNRFSNLTALVVGDVMIDTYLWGNVGRQSPEAPVPVLNKTGKDSRIGGAGNVARNILSLGAKVRLASVIGNDISGKYLLKLLQKKGINSDAVIEEHARTTTVKTRIIKGHEHLLRIDEETTNPISDSSLNNLKVQISNQLQCGEIDVIIIEDYDKGVMSKNLAEFIITNANELNIPITVDPKLINFHFYKNATLFKPNLKELKEGLETEINPDNLQGLNSAVEKLHSQLNPTISLTTLGSNGMWLHSPSSNTSHLHEKGINREVIDVSGAGDTVIATASLMLAAGASLNDIAKVSNIAGGLVVEQSGVVTINLDSLSKEFLS
ncbi:MAG: D-glycero-beta-D-manno-heptose-7-phosphate kinase [Crocinitomicaceae bacterium]|nr:D-glycero-beta-D-manno-heptose-7-phosphate kinase [Crocinitomicaceae bacterium]|tara:strand:+ start:1115 stop:2095 length:981 start_codon:yes stop_codon:yes gene_type:complete